MVTRVEDAADAIVVMSTARTSTLTSITASMRSRKVQAAGEAEVLGTVVETRTGVEGEMSEEADVDAAAAGTAEE